jgi:hypothetical protein
VDSPTSRRAFVKAVMNTHVLQKYGKFLTTVGIVPYSRRIAFL